MDADTLRRLWSEVLGAPVEGDNPSFFESGGDSISALTLIFRLEEEQGVLLDVGDLFEAPRLTDLARRVDALRRAG